MGEALWRSGSARMCEDLARDVRGGAAQALRWPPQRNRNQQLRCEDGHLVGS